MRVCSFCGETNEDWMEICQRCGNSIVNSSNNMNYSPNKGVASYKAKGKNKVSNNNNFDVPQYNNYDTSYGYDMYYNNSYYDNQPMNEESGVKKSILANVDLKLLLLILVVILVVLLSYTIYSLI